MKLRNIYLGIKDQLPLSRLLRNIKSGNVFGLFFLRSHQNEGGKLKVMYNTKASATKAAESMTKKKGVHFSNYKCIFCDGYHLGKNRDNKVAVTEPTSVAVEPGVFYIDTTDSNVGGLNQPPSQEK